MPSKPILRIAFVCEELNYYTRQVAIGVSRYASPANGCITREFVVPWETNRLPPALESWDPDAVVAFIAAEDLDILSPLSERGLPIANTARAEPAPNRAVVLGDAGEIYRTALKHFEKLGITSVWHFSQGDPGGSSPVSLKERYRQYAVEHGLPCNTFWRPGGLRLDDVQTMTEFDEDILQWLTDLPKPAGIITQQTSYGLYLCRMCKHLNIKVPDEIALIGTDGFDTAMASDPPVTSIRLREREIGFEAARIAVAMQRGLPAPQQIVSIGGVTLIPRQSTRIAFAEACDVDVAVKFICDHACEGVKVQDVISHTQSVSRMTFHKRFLQQTGLTPAAMIQQQRMGEARRLLSETEISPGSIAGMCGYTDYMHFYRTFRGVEGVSPNQYRHMVH